MDKKMFLGVLFLLIISSMSVSGVNEYVHLKGDSSTVNSGNDDATFAWTGTPAYVTGKIGSAFNLNISTVYIRSSNLIFNDENLNESNNWSIAYWVNAQENTASETLWAIGSTGTDLAVSTHTGSFKLYDETAFRGTVTDNTTGNYKHITMVHREDLDKFLIYEDGINTNNISVTLTMNNAGILTIGANRIGTGGIDSYIDDFRIYNFSLTTGQVNVIYNTGLGTQESLENLSLFVNNVSISPSNPEKIDHLLGYCDITDVDSDKINYEYAWHKDNSLYSNGNTSLYYLYQENATVYNISLGIGGFSPFLAVDGDWTTYTIPASSGVWYLNYFNYTIPANVEEIRWQVSEALQSNVSEPDRINITIPYSCINGNSVLELRVNVYRYAGSNDGENDWYCKNSTAWQLLRDDARTEHHYKLHEEAIWWGLRNYSSNINNNINNISSINTSVGEEWVFSCRGFDGLNYTSWVNSSAVNISDIFINFTFKDEITDSVINNVDFEVISDIDAQNYSITTGNIKLSLDNNTNYLLRYSSSGYANRNYNFKYFYSTPLNLTLYLLNGSNAQNVTTQVYDQTGTPVENVNVNMLRYYLDCNCFLSQQIESTNFLGQASFSAELNSELYKFILTYEDTVYLQTSAFEITADILTFFIDIGVNDPTSNLRKLQNVLYNLSYNQDTENFVFTYDDLTDTNVIKGCLEVYKVKPSSETLIENSCVESGTASIIININPENFTTYRADSYVYFEEDESLFLESITFTLNVGQSIFGNLGLLLTIFALMIFALIGIWNPNVSIILVIFGLIISTAMGILSLAITALTGIIGVAIILLIKNKS